jgi:hypothetical protein
MTTQQELMEQLVRLTDAVKQLADREPAPTTRFPEVTEAARVRQRVAFGYQALGSLLGRVSSSSGREFDTPVVAASRRAGLILLDGLPRRANWVELRRGAKVELLQIFDGAGVDRPVPAANRTPRREDRDNDSELGAVFPDLFADAEAIGSIVVLRHRRGPVLAFGPRLAPVTSPTDRPNTD